jgi:hypothetical protein
MSARALRPEDMLRRVPTSAIVVALHRRERAKHADISRQQRVPVPLLNQRRLAKAAGRSATRTRPASTAGVTPGEFAE